MSELRGELKYLSSHEWARVDDDGVVTIGITDHAQESLGDVVFVELPELGASVVAGEEAAVVESVKAASDIFSLVSGKVIANNEELIDEPEIINESPYDKGWFFKVQADDLSELENALDAAAYAQQIEEEG